MSLRIRNSNVVIIDSINELNIQDALTYKKIGIKEVVITAPSESTQGTPGFWQRSPYPIDEYIVIKDKIDELTEGIDQNIPEKERFAELYKRVCNNITYDYAAAYPKTEEEKQYSVNNLFNCRNLRNGLLEGKCVCAGYADILHTALEQVGIESIHISGPIVQDRTRQKRKIERYKKLSEIKIFKNVLKKRIEKLEKQHDEFHAWLKVKLDGKWYNADPTWDSESIKNGKIPYYALQTDEQCKYSRKLYNPGPVCSTEFSEEERNELFEAKNKDTEKPKIPLQERLKADFQKAMDLTIKKFQGVKNNIVNLKQNFINILSKRKKELPPAKRPMPILRTWDETNQDFYILDPMQYYGENAKKADAKNKLQTQKLKSWDLRNWNLEEINVNPQKNSKMQESQKQKDIER